MKKKLGHDVPPLFHMDDIAVMSDDEVWSHVRTMDAGRRSNRDPQPFEVELAYLQRELGIRRDQREAHTAWLRARLAEDPPAAFDDEEQFEVA
ncbi:MAG: hypothetical protein EB084_24175 [Proteobacteria bacterium]|nr:hypothetical protein [Pseudomonadota bacterium]